MKHIVLLASLCYIVTAAVAQARSSSLTLQGEGMAHWGVTEPRGFTVDWDERRLVQLAEDQEPVWMTELEKFSLKAQGVGFLDLTENLRAGFAPGQLVDSLAKKGFSYPTPSKEDVVQPVLDSLTTKTMTDFLKIFTSFETRDYRSPSGKLSQKWLFSRVGNLTEETASDSLKKKIAVTEFAHSFGQNSVIARINGSSGTDETIVLSAHQDSTNRQSPYLRAPGADDDGSGSATIFETYRAILASDFHPERNVEFHWYAAEEGGLLGSQLVTLNYALQKVNVVGNLHFDTIASVVPGEDPVIGFVSDYTDSKATTFAEALVDKYCSIRYVEDVCEYGCSDHHSWTQVGYSSASTTGSAFQIMRHYFTKVHTPNDTYDDATYSFSHLIEFAKLATAYTIELGGTTCN